MTPYELVVAKHAIERELRELERRERVNVTSLQAALDVMAEHQPATGLSEEHLLALLAAQGAV